MKQSRLIAVGTLAAAVLATLSVPLAGQASTGSSHASAGKAVRAAGTQVSVRVEGISSTLLPETVVNAKSTSINKDGKPADTCEGNTAAVALQDATKGHWTAGSFSSGLGYPVIGIRGEEYPFTSNNYWSFWIDGKPATTGICGALLHKGEHLLFFPQCALESASGCTAGTFSPSVLALTGPSKGRVGKAVKLSVSSLANLTGKASKGAGVKLSAGGHSFTTNAAGKAKLKFAKAGTYRIVATAPGSIRDELTVKVRG